MGEAQATKDAGVKVAADGSEFESNANSGGSAYDSNGDPLNGVTSAETTKGTNMLESTDFYDTDNDNEPGVGTNEITLEYNYIHDDAAQQTLRDAEDNDDPVNIAVAPDRNNPTQGGHEMTCYVSEMPTPTSVNEKVTQSVTLVCADGDGLSRLTS
jgi:hypothetical protein